ncbi:MAG: response regulator transcription factor [Acidobacteria bacterium]|nr:response regulator transcription factor [Acidobacteriaceae bacterium]MBV9609729.1 response regulator transcription factor [Acidobacteriota bacterium]
MTRSKPKILIVSRDPALADVRKSVLERAGYPTIPASDFQSVRDACQKFKVGLVMIGYSVPPAEKRRAWSAAREVCKTPILELVRGGKAEIIDSGALFVHQSHTPVDFLQAVQSILGK